MKEIYLDNAATTRPTEKVIEKMTDLLRNKYGNPSSLHQKGLEAEQELEYAKKIIADELNARADEIYFTSGGTESNNLAALGATDAQQKRGNKIITSIIEHSSVYAPMRELEKKGWEVIYLKPDHFGNISESQIIAAIDEKTILVSLMLVNNEVGSILPLKKIKNIIRQKKSPAALHIDAVQAFGKISVDVEALNVDLLSVSAHKIHGPKGVGALYLRKGVKINPRLFGGQQQRKIRPGTESVPNILGFATAVQEVKIEENFNKIKKLNQYCREQLLQLPGVCINSSEDAIPYILNFSTNKIKSETMLHYLSSHGIYISSGSACAKGQKSRVLQEMNLSEKAIDTALRISFSDENSMEDIDRLISCLKNAMKTLAHI